METLRFRDILPKKQRRENFYRLRQRPHYVGEIWKPALFLLLGLPSTLIRHENGAFRKRSSNRNNLKTRPIRFRVDGKHFENDDVTIITWFPWPSFPQTQIQNDR